MNIILNAGAIRANDDEIYEYEPDVAIARMTPELVNTINQARDQLSLIDGKPLKLLGCDFEINGEFTFLMDLDEPDATELTPLTVAPETIQGWSEQKTNGYPMLLAFWRGNNDEWIIRIDAELTDEIPVAITIDQADWRTIEALVLAETNEPSIPE